MPDNSNKLFENLQTLPGLIGQLGLSIAEAQQTLDQNYMENLTAFANLVLPMIKDSGTDQTKHFLDLFKSVAPSRYQFTETVVEVRADLQMASAQEIGVSGTVRLGAVAINAAYTKRSAYDYQAAALIRTTLNAIPASDTVLDKLLDPKNKPGGITPASDRLKKLTDSMLSLPQLLDTGSNSVEKFQITDASIKDLKTDLGADLKSDVEQRLKDNQGKLIEGKDVFLKLFDGLVLSDKVQKAILTHAKKA